MDDRLQRLERAHRESPRDVGTARELGQTYLRLDRPGQALRLLRPLAEAHDERIEAARGLAAKHGWGFEELEHGCERFRISGQVAVLVPGGAFLDEGANAWTSTLELGGSRASLQRVVLPDYLISVRPQPAASHGEARRQASARGGHLPSPVEWKKAWRGGLFLDGDETGQHENPEPDRIAPWGNAPPPPPGLPAVSPYGTLYDIDAYTCEWTCLSATVGLVLKVDSGRYQIPLATTEQRRGLILVYRTVWDLPADV